MRFSSGVLTTTPAWLSVVAAAACGRQNDDTGPLMNGPNGGHHAGEPWHHVASDWRRSNGSHGMAYGFATA